MHLLPSTPQTTPTKNPKNTNTLYPVKYQEDF